MGDWIDVAATDGGRFRYWMAKPQTGGGPGLVLCGDIPGNETRMRNVADLFAEEGYIVIAPDQSGYGMAEVAGAVSALRAHPACTGKIGALGFGAGCKPALFAAARGHVDCAVAYCGIGIESILEEIARISVPVTLHFAGEDRNVPGASAAAIRTAFIGRDDAEVYDYAGCGHDFHAPESPDYDKPAAGMAHSRSIALLRRVLGPKYDLNALWEQHLAYEFTIRDADANMKTMVAEPYVNHIPTMTGGVGHDMLKRFYKHHFIGKSPQDRKKTTISRTVGADRIVDEGVFTFTHDEENDWLLPGVKPTGRKVSVAMVAVVCFRGDKIYHEHIYWDQASVLIQVGLLKPDGLPAAGLETAQKVLDESLPSNTLMAGWKESEGLPI